MAKSFIAYTYDTPDFDADEFYTEFRLITKGTEPVQVDSNRVAEYLNANKPNVNNTALVIIDIHDTDYVVEQ